MNIVLGVAVFYVMWWIVLFAILPWGVKTAQETGEQVVPGQATSAPQKPLMLKKVIWTTVVTSLLFGLLVANNYYGWLTLDDLPGPSTDHLILSSPRG